MIRVLVFGMTENPGGVESFLINYYRNIDRERIQFDFLCNSHESVAYEEELLRLGGRTFHITARSKNKKLYKIELENVFRLHASEWSAIWVNVCSLANIDYLIISKRYCIKKRIIHSHNSRNMDKFPRVFLHYWNKHRIKKYATDFWACSDDAAQWFFNDELINQAIVIHNAIDVENMRFNSDKRKAIREKFSLGNKYVIGNIGRLHFQKNQEFAIEVFRNYHESHPESVLILIGQGEDEKKLKLKVKEYEIEGSVLFVGVQNDIQGWLSCFDLFLFPSRFEGLSISALEAQANGLPILASKGVIPLEVKMNDNFLFMDLKTGIESWAKEIDKIRAGGRIAYESIKSNFTKNGYNIKTEANKVERLLGNYYDGFQIFEDGFQIFEVEEHMNHAGEKATVDISCIADGYDIKTETVKLEKLSLRCAENNYE